MQDHMEKNDYIGSFTTESVTEFLLYFYRKLQLVQLVQLRTKQDFPIVTATWTSHVQAV